jgi:type IV secretory pathway VirJ component
VRTRNIVLLLSLAAVVAAVAFGAHLRRPRLITTDQFDSVRVFPPWVHERGFVYVLSGDDGWKAADEWTALTYAALDNYVVGIDTPELLKYLNRHTQGCLFMPGLFEDYSRVQERTAVTAQDYEPLVLGRGSGASLAYLGQIGAPSLALGAAVMLNPEPRLMLKPPVCEHPATPLEGGLQQLRADAFGNNVPARLWLDANASPESRAFAASIPGHPAAAAPHTATLRGLYASALSDIRSEQQRSGVSDLPLVEVPAAPAAGNPSSKLFAVLYSGDGGWRDLDRSLAGILAARGISVVGVDVLRYYWRPKTPEVAARDLARIVQHYQKRWGGGQVLLIGYSFGADVLPFMVNRLPASVRADIKLMTLLAPERTTAFEVSPAGWVGKASDATIPIEPELKGLSTIRVQCVYGDDEAQNSLCTTEGAKGWEMVRKPGGHHFDRNYDELANDIMAAAAI